MHELSAKDILHGLTLGTLL